MEVTEGQCYPDETELILPTMLITPLFRSLVHHIHELSCILVHFRWTQKRPCSFSYSLNLFCLLPPGPCFAFLLSWSLPQSTYMFKSLITCQHRQLFDSPSLANYSQQPSLFLIQISWKRNLWYFFSFSLSGSPQPIALGFLCLSLAVYLLKPDFFV